MTWAWRGKRAGKVTERGMIMSPREHQVALRVERDLSNYEIARELGITVGTVKFHVHNLKKRGLLPRPRLSSSGATTADGIERIRAARRRRLAALARRSI
jgi:DNA-binding CsgD family transcriptional regulator